MAMTIKRAKELHPLASAVLRQLGGGREAIESARDAARHGADGGFHGFIWYTETQAFTKRNRAAIREQIEEDAESFGTTAIELVRSFRCLNGDATERDVAAALYGGSGDPDGVMLVENALAWYALESVGSAIESDD